MICVFDDLNRRDQSTFQPFDEFVVYAGGNAVNENPTGRQHITTGQSSKVMVVIETFQRGCVECERVISRYRLPLVGAVARSNTTLRHFKQFHTGSQS